MKTENLLLKTAVEIFAKEGFEATSVHMLAEKSGVNVSLINRYFGGKEGLLNAITERAFSEVNKRSHSYDQQENFKKELLKYSKAEMEYYKIHEDIMKIFIQQSIVNKNFRKKLQRLLYENQVDEFLMKRIESLQKSKKIHKKIKSKDLQLGVAFQIFCQLIVSRFILDLPDEDTAQLLELYIEMITNQEG